MVPDEMQQGHELGVLLPKWTPGEGAPTEVGS